MNGTLTSPEADEGLLQASSSGLTIDWEGRGGQESCPDWLRQHRQEHYRKNVANSLVGDAERERSFRDSICQVLGYRSLPNDWDTYGGLPASDVSVEFARNLLNELRWVPELLAPYVCPISTGVFLEWRFGDARLYFEVEDDSVLFVREEGALVLEDGEDAAFDVRRAVELVHRFHRSGV